MDRIQERSARAWTFTLAVCLVTMAALLATPERARAAHDCAIPETELCGAHAVNIYVSNRPSYVGWARVERHNPNDGPTTMDIKSFAAWQWYEGWGWYPRYLREGTWVYVSPYTTGWSWVWTESTGWLAMQQRLLFIRRGTTG